MATNPRFLHLLDLYAKFDHLALALAGIAAVAVLLGFLLSKSGAGKFTRFFRNLYLGFCILAFVMILAGCTYLLITGGFA